MFPLELLTEGQDQAGSSTLCEHSAQLTLQVMQGPAQAALQNAGNASMQPHQGG